MLKRFLIITAILMTFSAVLYAGCVGRHPFCVLNESDLQLHITMYYSYKPCTETLILWPDDPIPKKLLKKYRIKTKAFSLEPEEKKCFKGFYPISIVCKDLSKNRSTFQIVNVPSTDNISLPVNIKYLKITKKYLFSGDLYKLDYETK